MMDAGNNGIILSFDDDGIMSAKHTFITQQFVRWTCCVGGLNPPVFFRVKEIGQRYQLCVWVCDGVCWCGYMCVLGIR